MAASTQRIRVLIVDDHSLFRQGLRRLLEAEGDFLVMGDCATIDKGLEILRSFPLDVVLLDFDLGLQRAFEFQTRAQAESLERPTLIVTAGLSQIEAGKALALGARGVVVKHAPPDVLVAAIRRVVSGGEWIDSRYAQARAYAEEPADRLADADSPTFSNRERSVLRGVLQGQSNKEIAGALEVSEASVKAAMQRLFQKAGVRTRGQLVRVALEQYPEDL